MRSARVLRLLAVNLCLCLWGIRSVAADQADVYKSCSALIDHGIYNYLNTQTTKVISREDYQSTCQEMSAASKSGSSAAMEVVYKKLPVKASFSTDKFAEVQNAVCSLAESKYYSLSDEATIAKIVSKDALAAWSHCLELASSPDVSLSYEVTPNQESVLVYVTSRSKGGLGIESITASGALSCSGTLWDRWTAKKRKAFTIGVGGKVETLTMTCQRKLLKEAAQCGDVVMKKAQLLILTDLGKNSRLVADIPAERAGCDMPRCVLTGQQLYFAEGPAIWNSQQGNNCSSIPTRMRATGTPSGGVAAHWRCDGFLPKQRVSLAASVAVRAIRADRNTPGDCHCYGTTNEVFFQAQLRANSKTADSPLYAGAAVENCADGLDATIPLTVNADDSGVVEIDLVPTRCEYRGVATCRFVEGTSLTVNQ